MTAAPHGALELVVNGATAPWTHVMAATSPFNMAGLPALSVSYAFSSEKLPIGIQLVAKWLDEDTIPRLGAMLERRGGLKRSPSQYLKPTIGFAGLGYAGYRKAQAAVAAVWLTGRCGAKVYAPAAGLGR
jgi:hypothetical protein